MSSSPCVTNSPSGLPCDQSSSHVIILAFQFKLSLESNYPKFFRGGRYIFEVQQSSSERDSFIRLTSAYSCQSGVLEAWKWKVFVSGFCHKCKWGATFFCYKWQIVKHFDDNWQCDNTIRKTFPYTKANSYQIDFFTTVISKGCKKVASGWIWGH